MKDKTKTLITGASDDLIEIKGELEEEFDAYDCENGVMAFSDGTLLSVRYDEDGLWRFMVKVKGNLYAGKEEGCVNNDTNDAVTFNQGLKWCVFSKDMQTEIKQN